MYHTPCRVNHSAVQPLRPAGVVWTHDTRLSPVRLNYLRRCVCSSAPQCASAPVSVPSTSWHAAYHCFECVAATWAGCCCSTHRIITISPLFNTHRCPSLLRAHDGNQEEQLYGLPPRVFMCAWCYMVSLLLLLQVNGRAGVPPLCIPILSCGQISFGSNFNLEGTTFRACTIHHDHKCCFEHVNWTLTPVCASQPHTQAVCDNWKLVVVRKTFPLLSHAHLLQYHGDGLGIRPVSLAASSYSTSSPPTRDDKVWASSQTV